MTRVEAILLAIDDILIMSDGWETILRGRTSNTHHRPNVGIAKTIPDGFIGVSIFGFRPVVRISDHFRALNFFKIALVRRNIEFDC